MFTTGLTTNNFPREFRLPPPNRWRQLGEPYARWLLKVMRMGNVGQHSGNAVRPRLRVIEGQHAGQGSKRKAWHMLMKRALIKHSAQRGPSKTTGGAFWTLPELREQSYPIMSAQNKHWPSPSLGRPTSWQLVLIASTGGGGEDTGWWVWTLKQHLAGVSERGNAA